MAKVGITLVGRMLIAISSYVGVPGDSDAIVSTRWLQGCSLDP